MYIIASRDVVVINAYGNESLSIVQRPPLRRTDRRTQMFGICGRSITPMSTMNMKRILAAGVAAVIPPLS